MAPLHSVEERARTIAADGAMGLWKTRDWFNRFVWQAMRKEVFRGVA